VCSSDLDRRVAELELAISRQQYRQQILKSASEALSAYWQLYKAYELKRMREEARAYAQRGLDDAQSQQAVGRASRTTVTEARALLGLRQVEVLRADQGVAEAEAKVKTLLSLPGQTYRDLHLKPVQGGETVAPATQDWSDARLETALEAWPPWKVALLRRDQGQARLDYARNQTRPALDMVASCSNTRLAYDSGEVLDNIATRDYPDCYLGFNLEFPLQGNRKSEGQYQAQVARIGQSDLELEAVRGALANDLLSRSLQWERAVAETAEMKRDVELRQELLDAERTQMGMGLSRLSQVIERENALNESRARLLDSLARLQLAQVGLDLAQGVLLQRHNIEWVE
jgi:outer membrane protein TolC